MSEEGPVEQQPGVVPVVGPPESGSDWRRSSLRLSVALVAIALVVAGLVWVTFRPPAPLMGALTLLAAIAVACLPFVLGPAASAQRSTGGEEAPPGEAGRSKKDSELDTLPTDALTGLPTFQPFSQRLLEEFRLVKATGGGLALVLVDINHLARVNDHFGTEAGDEVLRHLTRCLMATKRGNDVLARMGDDEFALLLVDCDGQGARAFIERLNEWLAREPATANMAKKKTASIWVGICAGMACADGSMLDTDELLTAAVEDLNAAQQARDRRRQRWERAA